MRLRLANRQQRDPVPTRWLGTLACRAARHLKITGPGSMAVTFVDGPTMQRLNRQFTGHRHLTDVLSFNYLEWGDGLPRRVASRSEAGGVVGEILVAPAAARRYAQEHGVPYREELARYVVHGLLHWLGHEDRTLAEQRRMRAREDAVLTHCEALAA